MSTKRLFIAIPLPDDFINAFVAVQQECGDISAGRWTAPENLHITVKFLGNVASDQIPALVEAVKNVSQKTQEFTLTFKKIIYAPPEKPPRMVWATFTQSDDFTQLMQQLNDATSPFSQERDSFKEPIPHVTMARLKSPQAAKTIELIQPELTSTNLSVTTCELIESTLSSEGSKYALVESFPFVTITS
ncbi:RNA 2',3'-cyclic phosphodiesterase [Patescibacteria group bacterium]